MALTHMKNHPNVLLLFSIYIPRECWSFYQRSVVEANNQMLKHLIGYYVRLSEKKANVKNELSGQNM